MKRPRPYIPLSVRVKVARRQFDVWHVPGFYFADRANAERDEGASHSKQLFYLLHVLFGDEPYQLDHDPALILRKFNPRSGLYTPRANDPDFLVYRTKAEHQHKTTGRKPGAEKTVTTKGSDIWLKSKFARLEGRTKRRPKVKIPARKKPWPTRKFKRKSDV